MNTILPSCCLEHSGTVLCVNTRETSAILCWLRRGDQLGNRQNAKLLFRFFSTSLFISHSLLPFLLSPKNHICLFFSFIPHSLFSSNFLLCSTLLFKTMSFILWPCYHLFHPPSLCAWWSEPPEHLAVSSQSNKAVIHTSCPLIQASLKGQKLKNKGESGQLKIKPQLSGWKCDDGFDN